MNKQNKAKIATTCVTFVLSISAVFAVETTLPIPPPSEYADTESRFDFAVTNWPGLGRNVKLTLSAHATSSNCVQVAFGQDSNDDSILAPEETHLILGVDCGVPFIRNEVKVRGEGEQRNVQISSAETEEGGDHLCSPSPSTFTLPTPLTFTFSFKQPSDVSRRITHAQVTTRGRGESAAQIAAEIFRLGTALFLR